MTISTGPSVRLGARALEIVNLDPQIEESDSIHVGASSIQSVQIPGTLLIFTGEDMYYEHIQTSPASTWTIQHNLGVHPNISVFDNSGQEILADVFQVSNNTASIIFPSPATGKAVCS